MGILYIVATPIGNLKDITLRAIEVLKVADYILCEDTRVTGKLLNHFDIDKQMISFNEFSENKKAQGVLADLISGKNVALVSDAGTPLISDPGFKLLRDSIAAGVKIISIPGPSAVITALTVSGKPPDKFLFLGYLPKKEGKRKEILNNISKLMDEVKASIVIYEAPYRLIKTLACIKDIFGDTEIVICRELTKFHEEVRREKVSEALNHFLGVKPRGELTIIF